MVEQILLLKITYLGCADVLDNEVACCLFHLSTKLL